MSFSIGQTIGPYRIVEQLGQGGMATVYKAYHASLDRYVAIKVLHQAFMEDKNFLARFQREARLVARLEHPNIVPVYDYAEHENQPYLVMKYIEGDTLKARLHKGQLSREEVTKIVELVGAGLAHAHKQGILHRDIKPSNVILADDGGIYLADFGLARIAQSGDSTLTSDMILGTPQYISPEQAMGKSDLDQGTDIYSFGVMVYEMTTGRVPFSADTPFSIIHDHIYSPLPMPTQLNPALSQEIERVLLKALAKDRQDRYENVASFVTDFLMTWQEDRGNAISQTLPAVPPPPPSTIISQENTVKQPAPPVVEDSIPPASAPKNKKRWIWITVGIILSLCLCCLAIGILNDDEIVGDTPAADPAAPERTQDELTEGAEEIPLAIIPLEQAEEALDANPESPIAHIELGLALMQTGDEIEGYAEIRIAADLARPDTPMLVGLARALENRERWPGALTMYLRLAETRPRLPMLTDNLRRAAYYSAGHPLAPEIVEVELLQKTDRAAFVIAQSRYLIIHEQDIEEALLILDEINKLPADFPEGALVRAEAMLVSDNPEEARAILTILMERENIPGWVREQATHFMDQLR